MPFFFLYSCVLFPPMFVNLRRCWWRIGHGMSLAYSGLWLYDQSLTLFSLLFLYVTIGVTVWHWHLSWRRGHFGVLWWFYSELNEISLLTNDLRRSLFLSPVSNDIQLRANLGQLVILAIPSIFAKRRQSNDCPGNIKYQSIESSVCWTAD